MRISIKLNTGKGLIPFNYQPQLTGAIHKWIGKNELHDKTSMYSFSWLHGGRKKANGLAFENGTSFDFSSHDNEIIKAVIKGIQIDPTIGFGLVVSELVLQEIPTFSTSQTFFVSSPVLVKKMEGDKEIHYTYDNVISDFLLTETLKTKLRKAGMDENGVDVQFLKDYPQAKTKIIHYRNIGNRVNICPVVITGTPEQIAFAWSVGVGNSTGIGFGSLK